MYIIINRWSETRRTCMETFHLWSFESWFGIPMENRQWTINEPIWRISKANSSLHTMRIFHNLTSESSCPYKNWDHFRIFCKPCEWGKKTSEILETHLKFGGSFWRFEPFEDLSMTLPSFDQWWFLHVKPYNETVEELNRHPSLQVGVGTNKKFKSSQFSAKEKLHKENSAKWASFALVATFAFAFTTWTSTGRHQSWIILSQLANLHTRFLQILRLNKNRICEKDSKASRTMLFEICYSTNWSRSLDITRIPTPSMS